MKIGQELLYLSRDDIATLKIDMNEVIDLLVEAFKEKAEGRVDSPPKFELHPMGDDNFINALLCSIPKFNAAGLKWIGAYPGNRQKNLPYLSGLITLNDPETGIPLSIMECGVITGIRTGAVTGLAARYLARRDSETVAILGCGVQARTQLEAILCTCPKINLVKAYDINPNSAKLFSLEMQERFGKKIEPANTPKEAVIDSDIIVTAGPILKDPNPVIDASWLKEGCFGAPIDYDAYWLPSAFQSANRIYTDDRNQFEYHRTLGYFTGVPPVCGDLGDLVSEQVPRRQNEKERLIAINLGLALEDIALAAQVFKLALNKGIGRILPV